MGFQFKNGFLLGVSSAATQIEGGKVDTNWLTLWKNGGIKDGTSPAVADEHWKRWQEDDKLLASMGIKISRVGIEWGRLVPEEGKIDESAVKHYREEFEYLIGKGVKPLLTIHHFSNPMWFEEKGGWVKKENCRYYLDLVRLVLDRFGDIISEYITINEPNVYATNSFQSGQWYPNHTSLIETFQVMNNMAYCHIRAYEMIHAWRESRGYKDTKVGVANHLRAFDPKDASNPKDVLVSRAVAWVFQGAITEAMCLGRFKLPLVNLWGVKEGAYSDFNGINYYSRSTISGFEDGVRENCPKNDLGWEIYPEGLIRCAAWVSGILYRPIWVTENGTCDNEDLFRCRYLYDHLSAISASPLPFERYYHWCFTDNWEWAEGQTARFGLVHNDYETQTRTVKKSGEFYREMIRQHGVTDKMFEKYVKDEKYNIK